MLTFGISIEKEEKLRQRMRDLDIKEADIRESFIRASGPGGQKVNKTSTCVFLQHLPTGLQVKCQEERSQTMNRFRAYALLLDKLEARAKEKELKRIAKIEKLKRQNRRRPKALKEKILEKKRERSQKKSARQKLHLHKIHEI